MMLRLYNTLTHKIEEFQPLNPPNVGYYSCGPTVYDFAHIGHARTYIFADVLQRVLEFNGYKVKRVMNITDVGHLTSDSDSGEDKMEKGAKREGKTVWEIAKFYTDDFFLMLDKLNIKRPEIICKATDYIKEMIDLIKKLEEKDYTYKLADGIYFDTSKLPDYGKLTGQTFEKLQKTLKAGARVDVVEGKKYPTDFAMWKFTPPDVKRQMEWDSPYGRGFPGWHIECSAMAMKHLGDTIDIHTGGVDHVPIHHTNEIAQSEAATGKPFVKYWLHADHLLVDGAKMSKSLGNYYRVKDLEEKGFSPLALRYLYLTANYRTQLNFTWESMKAAQTAYDSLKSQISDLLPRRQAGKSQIAERSALSEEKLDKINKFRDEFTQAINDDLNTAQGLSVVWKVVKSNIPSEDKYDLLLLFDEVLGLDLKNIELRVKNQELRIPEEINKLVKKREEYRRQGNFKESDRVREVIAEKGYSVQDTPGGPIIISNIFIKKLIDSQGNSD
ncbi:cysteine--tRNA ligase [Candidatus Gottesmanbacteria bacterium]|nr:cysteine--tRNA ligase [Candidatus Gottesmanbacteria bacterium]MBI5452637.1 cysteine--tRNA ligase [Candidatus Gottesmanbacteria bacterium]